MKKTAIIGLAAIMLLPVIAIGCTGQSAADEMPPLNGGQEAQMIELTTNDFAAKNNIVCDVELVRPGSLIVSLGANPTTGFQWGEAEITDPSVVAQDTHNYVGPQSDALGAPGKDVWVFDSKEPGTATLTMGYSRPWEGGEQNEWTLTVNATVK